MDRSLNYQTTVRIDEILVVTRWEKQKRLMKFFKKIEKLRVAGYVAGGKESEFLLKETTWLEHETNECRVKSKN